MYDVGGHFVGRKTELVFVPGGGRGGGLTAARYVDDIPLDHVLPYEGFIENGFLLMHDNARCIQHESLVSSWMKLVYGPWTGQH